MEKQIEIKKIWKNEKTDVIEDTNGNKYSCFKEQKLLDGYTVGEVVNLAWIEKDGFKNIASITSTDLSELPEKKSVSPHIVNIKGKEFITITGLLHEAEKEGGIKSIETTPIGEINWTKGQAVVKAKVEMKDGRIFENIGSADAQDLNSMVKGNFVEMATTRALARAIRF